MTSPFDAAYAAWQAEAVKDGASCTTCLQAAIAAYEVAAPRAALRDDDVYRLNDTVWRDNPAESIAEAKQRLAPELEWDHPPVCPKCNALMWGEGESRVGVDRQRCRTCGFVRPEPTTSELLAARPVVVARDWRAFVNDVGARADEEAGKVSPSYRGPEYWKAYTEAFNRLFDSALVLHTDELVEKGAAHVADAALRHLNALRVAHGEPPLHLARPEP